MKKIYKLIGIGIGPSNLSTAALLQPHMEEVPSIFFDNKKEFSWYPGMLFPNAKMQVSFLKDLVTMVDPSSEYSFLNFLKKTGRLYMFAAKGMTHEITRVEFERYFNWVINQLPNLRFSSNVESVKYEDGLFELEVNGEKFYAENISLGIGKKAKVPYFTEPYLGKNVIHSTQFLTSGIEVKGKKVMIVGGGQSAAEIALYFLQNGSNRPKEINWISQTYNLIEMENSPFVNELYTPNYSEYFYGISRTTRKELIEKQKYTSDGISSSTLNELYEEIYRQKYMEDGSIVKFYMHSCLENLNPLNGGYVGQIKNKDFAFHEEVESDAVILCTGLTNTDHVILDSIRHKIEWEDENFCVNRDFSLSTVCNLNGKIFVHNGAKHVRGVADPNLSLLAWRSGIIINSILGRNEYDVESDQSIMNCWHESKVFSRTDIIE